jgi:hypothetical protein
MAIDSSRRPQRRFSLLVLRWRHYIYRLYRIELERAWKEVVVAKYKYYPGINLEEMRKTTHTCSMRVSL